MKSNSVKRFAVLSLSCWLLALSFNAVAEYPDRPIRLLVGFGAGSGTDVIARTLATSMATAMKQPIVVDNRPGAMTGIASEAVARAPADGYTLLLANSTGMSMAPAGLMAQTSYDPIRDFTPIGRIILVYSAMVSDAKFNIISAQEMVEYLKANPDKANCAAGNAAGRVYCEAYRRMMGIDMTTVPYKSSTDAVAAVMGGQAPITFLDTISLTPRIKQGQLHALAYFGPGRNAALPDVPAASEVGLAELPLVVSWAALYAPARLSIAVVARLNAELNAALLRPEVRKVFLEGGMEIVPGTPEDLSTFHRNDLEMWRKVIRELNIQPEG